MSLGRHLCAVSVRKAGLCLWGESLCVSGGTGCVCWDLCGAVYVRGGSVCL